MQTLEQGGSDMRSHTRKWKTEEVTKAVEEIIADLEKEPDRLSRAEEQQIRDALAILARAVNWKLDDLKELRGKQRKDTDPMMMSEAELQAENIRGR